jgi:hypothetical protein
VPRRDRSRCRTAIGPQPRALTAAKRQAILDVLHSDRFADLAPAEVWLLRAANETRERRRQATHLAAVKPELLATAPIPAMRVFWCSRRRRCRWR